MKINCDSKLYDNYITSSFDIAYSLSKALDLVNPLINNHHQRVAFIAGSLAREAGYGEKDIENVILAALLHDIGVVVEKEFHELVSETEDYENELCHVLVGSFLLSGIKLFPDLSMLVKYHHAPYGAKTNPLSETDEIPELSYLLHLADRIDILLDRGKPALEQRDMVTAKITRVAKQKFHPLHTEAFLRLADREHFWFDIEEQEKYPLIKYNFQFSHINLDLDGILETAKILSRIIDFRCIFTSTHSAGVAETARQLAVLMGLPEKDQKAVTTAGYLHDIGKLAIPSEILYKDDILTDDEIQQLRKHPYYTYTILNTFQIFENIKDWAAFHHEHLDGSGYPFHLTEEKLCLGSRILAVADVFTALTEKRPYRQCEPKESLIEMLADMVAGGKLDKTIVNTLIDNYDAIFSARAKVQEEVYSDFSEFQSSVFSNKICTKNINFISTLHADH